MKLRNECEAEQSEVLEGNVSINEISTIVAQNVV